MAEWADVSVTSQMTIVPLEEEPQEFNALNLEAKCPMCRTQTTAQPSSTKEEELKTRYPEAYSEREEDERRESQQNGNPVETITLYIGNTAKAVPGGEIGDGRSMYDWEFFVKPSNTLIVNEVEMVLVCIHPCMASLDRSTDGLTVLTFRM